MGENVVVSPETLAQIEAERKEMEAQGYGTDDIESQLEGLLHPVVKVDTSVDKQFVLPIKVKGVGEVQGNTALDVKVGRFARHRPAA